MPAKIAIVVCSHEQAPVSFAHDWAAMAMYSRAELPPEIEINFGMICGTYIHSARRRMLQGCIEGKYTHILWLDSDMRFPKETLIRLLNHDVPMVGVNYALRMFPTGFVAIEKLGNGESTRLETLADSTGLAEVDAIGFGALLMRQEVFHALPSLDEDPWFGFDWKPGQIEVGEDVHFCKLVRKNGIKIYVDQDLSKRIGHTGSMVYQTAMVPISQKVVADGEAQKQAQQDMQSSSSAA
jgi:hypothetical protein